MGGQRAATILVADDDPAIRLLCRVNLELEGYRVIEAGSAAELDEVLARDEISALLLDVRLGDDDGRVVARRLSEERPELPIAFFTGSVSLDDVRNLVDGVIPKPFTLEELSATVRRLAPL